MKWAFLFFPQFSGDQKQAVDTYLEKYVLKIRN